MPDDTSSIQRQATTLMARTFALVRACPAGRVTTYGWIARAIGYPRGARMIGWFMSEAEDGVPAQRVINNKGELTGSPAFGQKGRMRQLLEAEGIEFGADERVDLKRYGWDPARDLSAEELQHLLNSVDGSTLAPSERVIHLLRTDAASPLR